MLTRGKEKKLNKLNLYDVSFNLKWLYELLMDVFDFVLIGG